MLARASTSPNDAAISKNKRDEKALAELLGESFEESEIEVQDEIIEINLWEGSYEVFSLYRILYPFISGDDYSLDSLIMMELIKDFKLELKKALIDISYIHSGFLSVVRENNDRHNANTDI